MNHIQLCLPPFLFLELTNKQSQFIQEDLKKKI